MGFLKKNIIMSFNNLIHLWVHLGFIKKSLQKKKWFFKSFLIDQLNIKLFKIKLARQGSIDLTDIVMLQRILCFLKKFSKIYFFYQPIRVDDL